MKPKISVIIVNYNVKDFLEQALDSLYRALKDIPAEVIVVDNNSIDASVAMVKQRFPKVKLIVSETNLGFSGANNLAIKQAKGEYIVLLNPDTLVQEDTFRTLLTFFENTPDADAATCKILNPDGTFAVDCRHSIPTPSTAFWKLIGLNKIFPKSRVFGKYNLTYLDENEVNIVEAISGSFMMIKAEMVHKTGLLDENFFMYCEDIDYCHRINQNNGKIYYVPSTSIIHYKGESTKKNNIDYVITFNRSLYKFYKKHYQQKYILPFKWLILLGVIFRGIMIYSKNLISAYYPILMDVAIINLSLFFSFWYRYELLHVFRVEDFFNQYIIINIITTIIYLISALYYNLNREVRFYIEKIFKILLTTFLVVAAITFFFKQFAFSRFVVLISAISSTLFMVTWRAFLNKYAARYYPALNRNLLRKKALLVGDKKSIEPVLNKLGTRPDSGVDILGYASNESIYNAKEIVGFKQVTTIAQLIEFVQLNNVDMLIFATDGLPFKDIFTIMSSLTGKQIEFKMVPGHAEYMVGKSNIEQLTNLPLIEMDFGYGKILNRVSKRLFDITLSFILLILFGIPAMAVWFNSKNSSMVKNGLIWCPKKGLKRFYLQLVNILINRMSFVGATLDNDAKSQTNFAYKPGMVSLLETKPGPLNGNREDFEIHYLKNQSVFYDIEIILSSLLKRK